ncbi:MAG: hypothetical protein NXI24_17610 [bacterium]|nr:hypothetical protein [bacterium]
MKNKSLLEFKASPAEYIEINARAESKNLLVRMVDEYWNTIPVYTISRCPFCNKIHEEPVDTYTLRNWIPEARSGRDVFREELDVRRHCQHMVIVQSFINFNGIRPEESATELSDGHFEFPAEVPHVIGFLLENDMETAAVMHSLPICRIENGEFVPRYSLYTITYYAANLFHVALLGGKLMHYREEEVGRRKLVHPMHEGDQDDWWNLWKWVEQDLLWWLEPDQPGSVLQHGSYEEFPYKEIKGRRFPYWSMVPYSVEELRTMKEES